MTVSLFFVLAGGAFFVSLLAALMSATETAYHFSSRAALEQYAARDDKRGARLQKIISDLDVHLSGVSFTRVFAESLAAMLLVVAFMQLLTSGLVVALAATIFIAILSFFIVAVGPRAYGQTYPEQIIRFSASSVRAIRIILGPIANLIAKLANKSIQNVHNLDEKIKNEQLLSMVDRAAEQELLEEDEQDIIHSVVEFGDTIVREVMVPRTDMVTVSATSSIKEVYEEILRSRFSRVPVISGDSDDVVGVAYMRDLAGYIYRQSEESQKQTVTRIMKPPQFVPDLQRADDLLRQMQLRANHLALVVDEHGGIAGLVTMEDLIEELLGEISDEHDRQVPDFTVLNDGSYVLSAKLELEKMNEIFDTEIVAEDTQTVSGLVTKMLGRLPHPGDTVQVSGIDLSVLGYEKKRQKVLTYSAIDNRPVAEKDEGEQSE